MEHFDYARILVPTDMSDFATLALRYAAMFRERLGSSITAVYADEVYLPVDMLEAPLGFYLEKAPESLERLAVRLRDHTAQVVGAPVETLIVQDSPARAVLATAKKINADLILMGTHGRTGLRRAILGSVTENVLHEAKVPVMTVTPALMQGKARAEIRRILCPVNFTHVARQALQHACSLAHVFNAELSVLYVVEGIEDDRAAEVEAAFHQWVDPQVADRCRFTRIFLRGGDPAERVLAASADTDLIVIGAQHSFFRDATVIGTTTQRITRFARVPVLTVIREATAEVLQEEKELAASIM
jgi:nucleotide-binding universal stress UspA family protein